MRPSGIHSSPPLGLGHLLVEISRNVFAAVHVRCYLKQPVWPDFCHCPGILFAGEHQLVVDYPSWRVLQHANTYNSGLQVVLYAADLHRGADQLGHDAPIEHLK